MASLFVNIYRHYDPTVREEFSNRNCEYILHTDEALAYLAPYHRVLDMGCGTGWLVQRLRDEGHYADGITYQATEIVAAEERGVSGLTLGDLHALPWDDATFDGFVCWDALEHTVAPVHVLGEAYRVLRKGGCGVIFIPSYDKWTNMSYHVLCPLPGQMRHLCDLARFTVEKIIDLSDEALGQGLYFVTKD